MLVLVMLVSMGTLDLSLQVDSSDDCTILDEKFLTLSSVDESIELVGGSFALLVLLLEKLLVSLSSLGVLLGLDLGLLGFESCLGLSLLLLS